MNVFWMRRLQLVVCFMFWPLHAYGSLSLTCSMFNHQWEWNEMKRQQTTTTKITKKGEEKKTKRTKANREKNMLNWIVYLWYVFEYFWCRFMKFYGFSTASCCQPQAPRICILADLFRLMHKCSFLLQAPGNQTIFSFSNGWSMVVMYILSPTQENHSIGVHTNQLVYAVCSIC